MSFYEFVFSKGNFRKDELQLKDFCNILEKSVETEDGRCLVVDVTKVKYNWVNIVANTYLPLWKFNKNKEYKQFNFFNNQKIANHFGVLLKDEINNTKLPNYQKNIIPTGGGGYSYYGGVGSVVCGMHYDVAICSDLLVYGSYPQLEKNKEILYDWFYTSLNTRKIHKNKSKWIILNDKRNGNIDYLFKDYKGEIDKIIL